AQTLGGEENLRGLVPQRSSGRAALSQNVEARPKLFAAFTTFIPAEVGVLAFGDDGRVSADGEDSSACHQGYRGGLGRARRRRCGGTGTAGAGADGVRVNVRLRVLS